MWSFAYQVFRRIGIAIASPAIELPLLLDALLYRVARRTTTFCDLKIRLVAGSITMKRTFLYLTPTWFYQCLCVLKPCIRAALVVLISLCFASLASATAMGDKWVHPERSTLKETPGGMPFYPSRASTGGKQLTPEMFDSSETCKACHLEIYNQWKESVMAQAWDDPIYEALVKRASKATNGAVDNFCVGCHSPLGLTVYGTSAASFDDENFVPPGVNCEACHNISDISGRDNGAYVLTPTTNGKGAPSQKYGPRKDAESPYHETTYSELHTRSEFCAACHNVTHPFNGTPIERTYDEWSESAYNEEGVQCQDCHMTPGPGVQENPGKSALMGKEREKIYSHYFTGGNVTLHKYFGQEKMAERATAMLQSAATMEFVDPPEQLRSGQMVTVKLKVSNVGAGHKLPTGFPEGREIWVDFKVTDATGKELFRSGAVRDGHTEKGTKNFKVLLGDKDGNVVDLNVWEVDRVLSDNRILPKGYAIVDYTFVIPQEVQGPLTLSADLNYWPFAQSLVDELLGEGKMKVVITRMTSAEQKVDLQSQLGLQP